MHIEVWLYGPLARYGGSEGKIAALVQAELPAQSTVADLLASLELPTEERGITFINGDLSAMPGLQPDLGRILNDGDRIAFSHLKSMWPFQYRHAAALTGEMQGAVQARADGGMRSRFDEEQLSPGE
ncbi:MAG TPA: MoaD/ThiS family protein [Thermoflexia bacterium]|nr:MoaD/ThiS family protein [Thermoflexia bacterium]